MKSESDFKKYILSHVKSIYFRILKVYTFIPQEYILSISRVYTFGVQKLYGFINPTLKCLKKHSNARTISFERNFFSFE